MSVSSKKCDLCMSRRMELVIADPLGMLEGNKDDWEEDEGQDEDDVPEELPEAVLEDANRWLYVIPQSYTTNNIRDDITNSHTILKT
jgi:hypothetical protein